MPRIASILAATTIAVSALSLSVDAHTNMAVPTPKWPDNFYNGNSPYGRIDSDSMASVSSIPSYQGVQRIAKAMESYKTLRQLIMANVNLSTISGLTGNKECGLTVTTGEKQPIPDAVKFPWGHPGPCEVWCDNTRIFYNADCQGNNVGEIPVDKTKCAGVNLIQAMYVGVHVSNWEVYANCAPMVGGTKTDPTEVFSDDASGSGASDDTGDNASTTETPALTPATSSSSGSDASDDTTPTPTPTTDGSDGSDSSASASTAPTPTTTTPAASSSSGSGSSATTPSTSRPSGSGSSATTPSASSPSGSGSSATTTKPSCRRLRK